MALTPCSINHILVVFFLLIFLSRTSLSRVAHKCYGPDRRALLMFKSSITEDLSGRLATWRSSSDCCKWTGVFCNPITGRVTGLNLSAAATNDLSDEGSNSRMFGVLSSSIGRLQFLESLDVSNLQELHGKLPRSLSFLVNLKKLILNGNKFNGSIPSFTKLRNLEALNLASNDFSGRLPRTIGYLANVSSLDFSNNYKLSGPLPTSLGKLSKLKSLDIMMLSMSSKLPADLSNMRSLASLRILNCPRVSGPMPTLFPSCLEILEISHTGINGNIPASLGSLGATLKELDLSYNNLQGTIPASLGTLQSLTKMDLSSNAQLSGPIPPAFGKLSRLQMLTINECNLTGPLPQSIGGMTNLVDLSLRANRIERLLPTSIGNLANLINLVVDHNMLTGGIPDTLNNLHNLQSLVLDNNKLSGLPKNLSLLNNLAIVSLANNTNLRSNSLSGIATLPSLTTLTLSGCKLSIPIPPWISSMKSPNLQTVDLSNNGLTGCIPEALGKLNLYSLSLANNHLTGTIPSSLGTMDSLGILDLSLNHLTGGIPIQLSKLNGLFLLNVSYNSLSSKIPQVTPFTSFSVSCYSGNPKLCGAPLPSC